MAVCLRDGWRIGAGGWTRRMSAFPLNLALLLGIIFTEQIVEDRSGIVDSVRNFYGTVKVRRYREADPAFTYYILAHGETTHGLQFLEPPRSGWATTYYGPTSGVGRATTFLPGPRHVGLVGLGAGSLAAYGRAGDVFRFYDINPGVVKLAQNRFSYLRQTAAKIEIVMGDARLTMEDELRRGAGQPFDLLVLDAFSSDAIPVHLLTREAMAIYLQRLRPGGIIAVHISNRYLRLRPVVEGLAHHYGLASAAVTDDPSDQDWWLYATNWILLSKDPAMLALPGIREVIEARDESEKRVDWTDDHASLFGILK
jgi:SAM-dependent methyltransferase